MRSLAVLLALAAPAAAEPEIHVLTQANGQWVVSPPELAKDLNARYAADAKGRNCRPGFMTDVLVSWTCASVHRSFAIKGGKLVPFDLLAELKSKEALAQVIDGGYGTIACDPIKFGAAVSANGLDMYAS